MLFSHFVRAVAKWSFVDAFWRSRPTQWAARLCTWLMMSSLLTVSGCAAGEATTDTEATVQTVADARTIWLESLPEAVEASRASGKPILANFTGSDWCSWCVRLNREVFNTPEFQTWSAKNVILLQVDFPKRTEQDPKLREQNKKLASYFKVRGFPTVMFFTADGEVLGTMGYQQGGAKTWTRDAQDVTSQMPLQSSK